MSTRGWKFRFGLGLFFVLLTAATIACAYWFRSGTHLTKVVVRAKTERSLLTGATTIFLHDPNTVSVKSSVVEALVSSEYVLLDVLRLQIERTAINPLIILEQATTEIRQPFWK